MSAAELVVALAWPAVVLVVALSSFVFVVRLVQSAQWRELALKTVGDHEKQLKALGDSQADIIEAVTKLATSTQNEITRLDNSVVVR